MHYIQQSNQVRHALKFSKQRTGHSVQLAEELISSASFKLEASKLFSSPKKGENTFFILNVVKGVITLENGVEHYVGCGYSVSSITIVLSEDEAVRLIKAAHH